MPDAYMYIINNGTIGIFVVFENKPVLKSVKSMWRELEQMVQVENSQAKDNS